MIAERLNRLPRAGIDGLKKTAGFYQNSAIRTVLALPVAQTTTPDPTPTKSSGSCKCWCKTVTPQLFAGGGIERDEGAALCHNVGYVVHHQGRGLELVLLFSRIRPSYLEAAYIRLVNLLESAIVRPIGVS